MQSLDFGPSASGKKIEAEERTVSHPQRCIGYSPKECSQFIVSQCSVCPLWMLSMYACSWARMLQKSVCVVSCLIRGRVAIKTAYDREPEVRRCWRDRSVRTACPGLV